MKKILMITASILATTNAFALNITDCKALHDAGLSIEVTGTYTDDHSDLQNFAVTLQLHQPKTTVLGKIRIAPAPDHHFTIIRESDEEILGYCPKPLDISIQRNPADAKDRTDH